LHPRIAPRKTQLQYLEQINFEKVYLLCKDLPANPCHEMLVGELGSLLSKHFKVKML
jgi:hypothetical protein